LLTNEEFEILKREGEFEGRKYVYRLRMRESEIELTDEWKQLLAMTGRLASKRGADNVRLVAYFE